MRTDDSSTAAGDASLSDPGYGEAMAELEEILAQLENENPDVDLLASRVERAATLIEVCRRRISGASLQVERVMKALESEEAT